MTHLIWEIIQICPSAPRSTLPHMNIPLVITTLCASQLRQVSIPVINLYVISFMCPLPPACTPGNRGKCHVKQTDFSTLRDEAVLTTVTRVQCGIPGQTEARPSRKSRCRKLMLRKWAHVLRLRPFQCKHSSRSASRKVLRLFPFVP